MAERLPDQRTRGQQWQNGNTTESEPDKWEKLIERFFLVMAAKYGHGWKSQWRSEEEIQIAKNEWQSMLVKFHMDTIRKALDSVETYYVDRPPNKGQFRALMKNASPAHVLAALPKRIKQDARVREIEMQVRARMKEKPEMTLQDIDEYRESLKRAKENLSSIRPEVS